MKINSIITKIPLPSVDLILNTHGKIALVTVTGTELFNKQDEKIEKIF